MKIYTLTGDDGSTSLAGGRRIAKNSKRVEAYGSVDELIAWIGLLRDHKENMARKDLLLYLQSQLMLCAATLAGDLENPNVRVILPEEKCLNVLEEEIDRMDESLTPLKNFLLPGGSILISYCHIARCVCRRAERAVLSLHETEKTPEVVMKILNRLSDFLFVLSRKISMDSDNEEIRWLV